MKLNKLLILPLLLCSTVACTTPVTSNTSSSSKTSENDYTNLKIEIQKDGVSVSEFNIIHGETYPLTIKNSKNLNLDIVLT